MKMGSRKDSGGSHVTNISVSQTSPSGQFAAPTEQISTAAKALIGRSTTLTEALKAAAINAGDKPVETTDVAAIKEVETRATRGHTDENGGGVAAVASQAVACNEKIDKESYGEKKKNLRDVIAEIDVKVKGDKTVTSDDAEAAVQAEINHSPFENVRPGGVAESVTAAYKLNCSPSLL